MRTSTPFRRAAALLGVASIVFLTSGAGCENNDPLDIRPGFSIFPNGNIFVLVGGVVTLDVETENISNPVIEMTSSSPGVASVTNAGVITALDVGVTMITAHETTKDLSDHVTVNVVGLDAAAVVLDEDLSAEHQQGDTIALSRITHGRPADPDACSSIHLHTEFGEGGILIDGSDGPFTDPNPTVCGFGRIIAINPGDAPLRASPMDHHH